MDGQPDQAIAITHPVAYRTVAAPAPINFAAPAPITYPARAAFAYSMPVRTAVHYKSTPVVVGHSTQILKPSLAAPVAPAFFSVKAVAEEKAEEAETIAVAAPAYYAGAHFGLNLAAAVPAGDAPHFDELFTQEKVLAPVRTSSQITQQVTVRHPTKVNVESGRRRRRPYPLRPPRAGGRPRPPLRLLGPPLRPRINSIPYLRSSSIQF